MNNLLGRGAAVLVTSVALLGSACGAVADDVAASYRGAEIKTSTVDTLASDEAFSQLFGFQVGTQVSVVDAATARTVLDFLLEGEALIDAADNQGLGVEPDRQALVATITDLQSQGYSYAIDDLSEEAQHFLSRFLAADSRLSTAGGSIGAPVESDLRFVYDETAPSGRWDRTCVTMVASVADDSAAMQEALGSGVELAAIVDAVPGAQVALDPSQACATAADLLNLPAELAAGIESASTGVLIGPIEVDQGQGPALTVFFEIESTEVISFEAARAELEAEVTQSLLAVRIASDADVNPRYGDGVSLESAQSQTGQAALVARVQRPAAAQAVPDFAIQGP